MTRTVPAALLLACAATARAADGVAEQARAGVREVLARPEFQPLANADRLPRIPRPDVSWLPSLVRVLAKAFQDLFGGMLKALVKLLGSLFKAIGSLFSGLSGTGVADGAGVLGTVLLWAVVGAAVLLLVWLLVRLTRSARTDARAGALALSVAGIPDGAQDDALAHTPEDWRRRAERLAAGGNCSEALRALYLELLAGLHRAGAIDYDHSRTNTAYVFDLARGHPARAPFLTLTRRFDDAIYGGHEPDQTEFAIAMNEVDAVRGALVREAAHA